MSCKNRTGLQHRSAMCTLSHGNVNQLQELYAEKLVDQAQNLSFSTV
jgi:hypothetical protein